MKKKFIYLIFIILVTSYTLVTYLTFFHHKENIKDFYKNVIKSEAIETKLIKKYQENIKISDLENNENTNIFSRFYDIKSDINYYIEIKINDIDYFINNNEEFGLTKDLVKDKNNIVIDERFMFIKANYIKFHELESSILNKNLIVYMISDSKKLLLSVAKKIGFLYIISIIFIYSFVKVIPYIFPRKSVISFIKDNYHKVKIILFSDEGSGALEFPIILYVLLFTILIWLKIFSDVKLWYLFYGLTVLSILIFPMINKKNNNIFLINKISIFIFLLMLIHQVLMRFGYQGSATETPIIIKLYLTFLLSISLFFYLKKFSDFMLINISICIIFPLCIMEFRSGTLFLDNMFYLPLVFIPCFIFINKKLSS